MEIWRLGWTETSVSAAAGGSDSSTSSETTCCRAHAAAARAACSERERVLDGFARAPISHFVVTTLRVFAVTPTVTTLANAGTILARRRFHALRRLRWGSLWSQSSFLPIPPANTPEPLAVALQMPPLPPRAPPSASQPPSIVTLLFSSIPGCVQDFLIMFLHHLATISLITFSYVNNMARVGTLVMCLHDAADVLIEVRRPSVPPRGQTGVECEREAGFERDDARLIPLPPSHSRIPRDVKV